MAGEVDEQVGAPLDEQVLAHLEGEAEDGGEVVRAGRLEQLRDRAQRVPRHRLLGLLPAKPGDELGRDRPVAQRG